MTKYQTNNTRRTNISSDLHDQDQTNNTRRTNLSSNLHDQVPNQQYKKDQYI